MTWQLTTKVVETNIGDGGVMMRSSKKDLRPTGSAERPRLIGMIQPTSVTYWCMCSLQIIFICCFGYLECTADMNHLSSVPTLPVLEELSSITYSCLLTLTVVQNLVWSNQHNVSHFVIQCQLLPPHSPWIPCRPSNSIPSERLRLVNGVSMRERLTKWLLNWILQCAVIYKGAVLS